MPGDPPGIVLRPRTNWEAIDLGFQLVRIHGKGLFTVWLSVLVPVALLLHGIFPGQIWVAALLLWWLKPLFDRILLWHLHHALHGTPVRLRDLPGHLGDLILHSRLFLGLTLYRLDPARSFHLPVWQLEGLYGKARRTRSKVLDQRTRGAAIWLTVACLHMEFIIQICGYVLLYLAVPETVPMDIGSLLVRAESSGLLEWLGNGFSLLSLALIEPLYVAAGYGLYLNRRTLLEGMDLEVAFDRIANRLRRENRQRRRDTAGSGVFLLLFCMLCMPYPDYARAADSAGRMPPAQVHRVIESVLEDPDFQVYRDEDTWRYRSQDEATGEAADRHTRLWEKLAGLYRILIGVLLTSAILYLIIRYRRWAGLHARDGSEADTAPLPEPRSGSLNRPDSLPDDIPAEAVVLWERNRPQAALSLLYRGALGNLARDGQIRIGAGATEGDCLRIVEGKAPESLANYFRDLTRIRLGVTYAHQPPDDREFRTLISRWRAHFDKT